MVLKNYLKLIIVLTVIILPTSILGWSLFYSHNYLDDHDFGWDYIEYTGEIFIKKWVPIFKVSIPTSIFLELIFLALIIASRWAFNSSDKKVEPSNDLNNRVSELEYRKRVRKGDFGYFGKENFNIKTSF